nr:hypothetical protein [Tanacetum cinerariifolium]
MLLKIGCRRVVLIPWRLKRSGKNTPQCYTKPLDSLKNWNNRFFWVDECVFPTAVEWRTNASKDGMPANGTYSMEAVRVLDTHRTPIQKQPEMLLCLVEMDLFSLIHALNPTKVKTGSRPHAPHELPLLTLTAPHVIEMDEPAAATDSSGVSSAIERSPLDFAYEAEAFGRETAAPEMPPPEEVPITTAPRAGQAAEAVVVEPPAVRESRKRGHEGIDANAPPKSLRRDHADLRPSCSSRGRKSLAAMQLCLASNVFMSEGVLLMSATPIHWLLLTLRHPILLMLPSLLKVLLLLKTQDLKMLLLPPKFGLQEVCTGMNGVSPMAAYLTPLRLAKTWTMLLLRVARRDKRIQAQELEIKNLEALLETGAETKRAAEVNNAEQMRELEDVRAQFSDLKAFADVVSAGVAKGMSEGLKHGVEHGRAQLELESIEAYDPEAEAKFVTALQLLKDLKFSLLDELESLKDALMDVIMADLYLESDTGGDASQYIRDLHPSSSQLTIPVYPKGLALLLVDGATQTDPEDSH